MAIGIWRGWGQVLIFDLYEGMKGSKSEFADRGKDKGGGGFAKDRLFHTRSLK